MAKAKIQTRLPHHSLTELFLKTFGTGRQFADVHRDSDECKQLAGLMKYGYCVLGGPAGEEKHIRFIPTRAGHTIVYLAARVNSEVSNAG